MSDDMLRSGSRLQWAKYGVASYGDCVSIWAIDGSNWIAPPTQEQHGRRIIPIRLDSSRYNCPNKKIRYHN